MSIPIFLIEEEEEIEMEDFILEVVASVQQANSLILLVIQDIMFIPKLATSKATLVIVGKMGLSIIN